MKNTPNKLRSFRLINGYSEKQVAAYIGVRNPETITRWEKGESMPGIIKLFMLGSLYKVFLHQMYPDLYKELAEKLNVKMKNLKRQV